MNLQNFAFLMIIFAQIPYYCAKNAQKNVIEDVVDIKDFKKILRTKNNVLVCFTTAPKQAAQIIKVFREVAIAIKGQGTMVLVDCSSEGKKLCKKLKVNPEPYILKHYKDGDFNKDYDRRSTVGSMVNFMRDPTGDIPWEEDTSASDVVHLADAPSLSKLLKKEPRPVLIMFYAPWCGFCKTLKPEYAAAATELKGQFVMAAIDVHRPENSIIRTHYNITGFPTMLYYENGKFKYNYEGENNKNGLVNFMQNPLQPQTKVKEPEWSDTDSEIVHLTTDSFVPVLKDEASVLVMFYAPWCGHCKRMKPEYEKAGAEMRLKNIPGMLAAVDATQESPVASKYGVKGYPTVKYFSYGELKFDVNVRDADKIIEFMKDPKEPPAPPPPEKLWSEEESEVVHLNEETFKPFLKKKKHVLVIFYAPWCGHCKKAKPEFTTAAEKFKDDPRVEFAAVDCTQHAGVCSAYEVKGYPTLKYFQYLKTVKAYNGGRLEADFVNFMSSPDSPTAGIPPPTDSEWSDLDSNKHILQLTDNTFESSLENNKILFVMFYAPWCGHCKRMKPEFSNLATAMAKNEQFSGKIAVFDCVDNPSIAEKYKIMGFPTIKLFVNGKFISDFSGKRSVADMEAFLLSQPTSMKDEL